MAKKFTIGIIAPSSKVPEHEFALGVDRIREAGFEVVIHPHCLDEHLFFAGTDDVRARAVFEFAMDPRFSALWAARGGYGAMRLLPLLEKMTAKRGIPPKKLLMGFSDSTALLEFVRTKWGWATLHAPMPGLRKFCALPASEWKSLTQMIRGEAVAAPWGKSRLKFIGSAPSAEIKGELVGGNLAVWTALVGTPYLGKARGKILFFEDVDENLYRIDRMVQQLLLSGALEGARAVILGNFLSCRDIVPQVLASKPAARSRDRMVNSPKPSELHALRASMDPEVALTRIFAEVTRRHGIPVAFGLPVGHGPEKAPLPLGASYILTPRGELRLSKWEWKGR